MESNDAMDDFFGASAGPGALVKTRCGTSKSSSGQASSSAPTKSSNQAGPSNKIQSGSQAKEGRTDVKGKGKAGADDTPRAKGARPAPFSASAPAATSTKPSSRSAAVARVQARLRGDEEEDISKGKGMAVEGKGRKDKEENTGVEGPAGTKAAGRPGRIKKAAQPFPMSGPSTMVPQADDFSDDELSLDGEFPPATQVERAVKGTPIASSTATTSKALSQTARAAKSTADPDLRPRAPLRNRLDSSNHLQHLPSNNSPDPLSLSPKQRPRFKSHNDMFNDIATIYTRANMLEERKPLVPCSSSSSASNGKTPMKSPKKKLKVKARDPPKRQRTPVDDNGASEFFAAMSRRSTQDKKKEARPVTQVDKIEYVMCSQEEAKNGLLATDLEDDALDEFTPEELEYCAAYVERTNLCKYCEEPLPNQPSLHLLQMKIELCKFETTLSPGSSTPWEHFDPYCRRHEAETTIIPLGIRAGFPVNVDFSNLRPTLEQPWIRSRLEALCADPSPSTFYKDTLDALREMGHTQWQSSEKILAASFPGYYGDIGLNILMMHFLELRKWKLLAIPGLIKKDPHNFIQTVLVPESAVMLIMVDRGWTGEAETEVEKREEAMKIRAESWRYGHAAFPETMQEPTCKAEEKEWVVKYHEARGLPIPQRRKKRRKTPGDGSRREVIEVSSDTGASQTDASETASETSDVRLLSSRGDTEDEATDSENMRSRSTAGSDLVSTPPFHPSTIEAVRKSMGTDKEDDDEDMVGDTTIKMASQATTQYDDGLDDEDMVAAAEATEAAVRGRRGKSRG